ncbi:unnamed protein product [Mytilus edulis]|uniref:C-type lectin domain-containing protein n=1 Tax=Mytilus edulis TaxID=6550 RepID=A0A8S3RE36_MYTED|nr:unnamed protein product [Mytilus edulis]
MLHIAFCIAFFIVTVSVVLAQTIESYTKCVQLGTTSVNKFPFLYRNCISAIDGALMCTEVAECTAFTYDDLTKMCHLHQMIDTVNCDINKKNGEITFTKKIEYPIDLKKLGNSCYYYENTTELSWDDATEYCISQGGYLAEVTDEAEFELVNSMINGLFYISTMFDQKE